MVGDKLSVVKGLNTMNVSLHMLIKGYHAMKSHGTASCQFNSSNQMHEVLQSHLLVVRCGSMTPELTQCDDHVDSTQGVPVVCFELPSTSTDDIGGGTLELGREVDCTDVLPDHCEYIPSKNSTERVLQVRSFIVLLDKMEVIGCVRKNWGYSDGMNALCENLMKAKCSSVRDIHMMDKN